MSTLISASPPQALAHLINLRVSPQKLNLVVKELRNKKVSDAFLFLSKMRKRIVGDVKKLLQSAVANAENNHGLNISRLVIVSATVGKSGSLKRVEFRGRSKVGHIEKAFSRLTFVLQEKGV